MPKQELVLSAEDGYELSLAVFPAKEPKASIQIVHGMQEHKERYYDFVEFLSENGYNVIISDLRGHGNNAPVLSHIADKNGDQLILSDQEVIRKYIAERFQGVPLVLFGHSMGSMIARVILQSHSSEYSRAILSGYVNPNPAAPMAVALGNMVGLFKKPTKNSKLLTSLAVGPFTKSVKDRKTDLDWLSYNEENVQKYIADPLCGVEFTVGSYKALFQFMYKMGKVKRFVCVNKELPIALLAGKDDPCTGGEKGRKSSYNVLSKAGFTNIRVVTFNDMRHEILNETDKKKAYDTVLAFLENTR